ncbi:uncharacterized protein LOC6558864 isoform X2 [Drosophila grimshawi]|uniref:uncharacterized protein LOC6558864 isoform X2 n=1 Tax=Drosophila grimshawi TaxID=7222 RepID=UPI000C870528|nr:uncharacterized protein LOC6558864 isoform X2 [Drosophila grimshawi]
MANAQNNGRTGQSNERSIREAQQLFAETLCFDNKITWDLTPENQPDTLKLKIDNITKDPEVREAMFNSVWEQRKYTNRQSLTSLIFVMVAIDKTEEELDMAAESRSNWSCHPVYRTRRCTYSNSSSNCCMIFVDENGRVYQNWDAYLANNQLPAGIMVAPARGIYTLIDGIVLLENRLTPAASPRRKALQKLDGVIGVGGALACTLLALPVAAPIIAAAGVVSVSCVSYATARSSVNLVNRSIHEQSISVTNRSARKDWFAVVGGTVALGVTVANRVLARVAKSECEVNTFNEHAVNGFNISCIIISGAGLANVAFDLYLKKRDDAAISAMDVLQLSASLVVFTHSVYNFKLASTIIRESRNQDSFHVPLQNRQRSTYEQLSTVTTGNGGANRGEADIIRNVNGSPQELTDPTIWENYGRLAINGLKVALTYYGPLVKDRIIDSDNIDNVLSYLHQKIPVDLQKFVLKLANRFVKFYVKQIETMVQFYISTESVIYTIISQLLNKYAGCALQQLEEQSSEILNNIKKYYWSQNPTCFTSKIIKCEVCGGQYNYCDL